MNSNSDSNVSSSSSGFGQNNPTIVRAGDLHIAALDNGNNNGQNSQPAHASGNQCDDGALFKHWDDSKPRSDEQMQQVENWISDAKPFAHLNDEEKQLLTHKDFLRLLSKNNARMKAANEKKFNALVLLEDAVGSFGNIKRSDTGKTLVFAIETINKLLLSLAPKKGRSVALKLKTEEVDKVFFYSAQGEPLQQIMVKLIPGSLPVYDLLKDAISNSTGRTVMTKFHRKVVVRTSVTRSHNHVEFEVMDPCVDISVLRDALLGRLWAYGKEVTHIGFKGKSNIVRATLTGSEPPAALLTQPWFELGGIKYILNFGNRADTCTICADVSHTNVGCLKAMAKPPNRTQCFTCGKDGHTKFMCPLRVVPTCNRCGSPDHFVQYCPLVQCYKCSGKGHMSQNCNGRDAEPSVQKGGERGKGKSAKGSVPHKPTMRDYFAFTAPASGKKRSGAGKRSQPDGSSSDRDESGFTKVKGKKSGKPTKKKVKVVDPFLAVGQQGSSSSNSQVASNSGPSSVEGGGSGAGGSSEKVTVHAPLPSSPSASSSRTENSFSALTDTDKDMEDPDEDLELSSDDDDDDENTTPPLKRLCAS